VKAKSVPTKRAPDVWDSAAFSSIFLASSFSCSQSESTPAHTQVTQAVRPLLCEISVLLLIGECVILGDTMIIFEIKKDMR